ncbi:MAG: hypothetical protein ABEL04_12565 [Salinibacter sp.]|uniref:hypothetical protein n=1 Tax=Salinibacter sp. TaxID=2065818 RepID=UPI0035D509A6
MRTSAAHAARLVIAALIVGLLSVGLTACDSGGGGGNPLNGDLSVRIEGPSGLGIGYSQSLFEDTGVSVDGTNITLPDDGVWTKDLSKEDLEGELVGVRIEATTSSEEGITLQLLSDGEAFQKDTEPEQQGGGNLYVVEAGNTETPF